jgi:hypothetical protein
MVLEQDIRDFVTPSISTSDASSSEITAKIAAIEAFVNEVYFNGSGIPSKASYAVVMLVISKLLESPLIAKKYALLESEKLGDYQYKVSTTLSKSNTSRTWNDLAIMMLENMTTSDKYYMKKVNE